MFPKPPLLKHLQRIAYCRLMLPRKKCLPKGRPCGVHVVVRGESRCRLVPLCPVHRAEAHSATAIEVVTTRRLKILGDSHDGAARMRHQTDGTNFGIVPVGIEQHEPVNAVMSESCRDAAGSRCLGGKANAQPVPRLNNCDFSLPGVLGGRYRVFSLRSPNCRRCRARSA